MNHDATLIYPRERVDVFGAARSSRGYPGLSSLVSDEVIKSKVLNICIITQDFVGPVKNGGIGTAYTYAARALAQAGHNVTVAYSIKSCSDKTLEYWKDFYAEQGINFEPIEDPKKPIQVGSMGKAMSLAYRVLEWLKDRDREFDFVHASEWNANAYFCLQAKASGRFFQNTCFVIKCSSPTLWNRIGNAEPISDPTTISIMYMERRCVELADYVISGSQYLLNWMEDQGYAIPYERTYVQPNIFPTSDLNQKKYLHSDFFPVKELVFFGRLEPRKGLHFFVDALIQLNNKGSFDQIECPAITLLGKPRPGYDLNRQIKRLQNALGIPVKILDKFNQPQALDYLSSGNGRVAVLPSLMDNSPFGVYECLSRSIPFITSTAGGGKELISENSAQFCLFEPTPTSLAERLGGILSDGVKVPNPSFDFQQSLDDWMAWHLAVSDSNYSNSSRSELNLEQPLVSVCLAHHNRGKLLLNAVDSLKSQSYRNIELIIVDDGSYDEESLKVLDSLDNSDSGFPIKVVYQANKYLGAVRNEGIRNSNGKFILFMDDDNEAKPNEIEVFLEVALHTGAGILTSWSDSFRGDRPSDSDKKSRRIVFHGQNLALGLIKNPYGDSNCFVRRDVVESLGGFTEHYKVGRDDVEFFSRAILSGEQVFMIPEALYWYRINEQRMRDNQYSLFSGLVRVSEPFCQGLHPDLANILRYAQGLTELQERPARVVTNASSSNESVVSKVVKTEKKYFVVRLYEKLTGNPLPQRFFELGRRLVQRYPSLYSLARRVYRRL